jgi:hypothetical protein
MGATCPAGKPDVCAQAAMMKHPQKKTTRMSTGYCSPSAFPRDITRIDYLTGSTPG